MSIILDHIMYTIVNLGEKLRKARLYRGYTKQTDISKLLGIAKQCYNIWETGKSIPSVEPISKISTLLKISPLYFFSQDDEIEKYDMIYCDKESYSLKFVQTRIYDEICKFFQVVIKQPGIYLLVTPGGIGTTRAIYEFQKQFHSHKLKSSENKGKNQDHNPLDNLIIFDHAYSFSKEELHKYINENKSKTLLFVGNAHTKQYLKSENFKVQVCEFNGLGYKDYIAIIREALPEATLEIITLIVTETNFNLKKLSELIKKIAQQRMNSKWQMDFDSIMELCEKINEKNHIITKGA